LWNTTVEEHRRTVHIAILDSTAALIAEHGLAVTMSQVAQHTGIGRATLYKYFKDVEAIMLAWHERQVSDHLHQLNAAIADCAEPAERLRTALTTYADLSSTGHSTPHTGTSAVQTALALHQAPHLHRAQRHVYDLLTEVIAAAADIGMVRTDVPPGELATYCLHALAAAAASPSPAARDRLVAVTLTGLLSPTG
jgi:AcrR family transcriptional regulator